MVHIEAAILLNRIHIMTLTTLFHPVQCCQNTTHITLLFNYLNGNENTVEPPYFSPMGEDSHLKRTEVLKRKEPPITEILHGSNCFPPLRDTNSKNIISCYTFFSSINLMVPQKLLLWTFLG